MTIASSSGGKAWNTSVMRISTLVDPAAAVAGDGAERHADQYRERDDSERDRRAPGGRR